MQNLETGKDKIKKICEIIKDETLEPAKDQAQKIIDNAEKNAESILEDAYRKKDEILKKAKEEREKEKELFESALSGAGRQAVAALKNEIEEKLFNDQLVAWIEKTTSDPKIASELIASLIKAINKEGTSTDFSAYIPETISPEKVNALLGQEMVKQLREGKVVIGEFMGGVKIKLHDKKVTLDLSEGAILDILSKYVRKEFRKILFHD